MADTSPYASDPPPRAVDDVVRGVLALADVADERRRQDRKWGEQNHPDGTGARRTWAFHALVAAVLVEGPNVTSRTLRDVMRAETDAAARSGRCTWAHILLEEVFEALAEDDPIKVRDELVQVAAVATTWIEAIDRRGVPRRGDAS